jgi:hypothetical protein
MYRASSASYWSKCAAYSRFTRTLDSTTNDAALEGTCAAWLAAQVIDNDLPNANEYLNVVHEETDWKVDVEMIGHINKYVEILRSIYGELSVERRVVASANPYISGTYDACVLDCETVHIIDLKYGRNIVECTSPQLVIYAWGAMNDAHSSGNTLNEFKLSIYQPRASHSDGKFRTRTLSFDELKSEYVKLLRMAEEGEKPDSLATPGNHCNNCKAASKCEALAHSVYRFSEVVTSRVSHDLSASDLSLELDFIHKYEKMIEARFNAIRNEAEERLKIEVIPNWIMERSRGHRKFSESADTIHLMTGIDPYVKSVCTPAELERRGASSDTVKLITVISDGKHKLKRLPDNYAETLFSKVKK